VSVTEKLIELATDAAVGGLTLTACVVSLRRRRTGWPRVVEPFHDIRNSGCPKCKVTASDGCYGPQFRVCRCDVAQEHLHIDCLGCKARWLMAPGNAGTE